MELIKIKVRGVRRSKRGKKRLKCELEGRWMLHRYRGAVGDVARPLAKPDPITPCQSAPQRAYAKLRRLPISARHPHACGRGRVRLCGFFCLHNRNPHRCSVRTPLSTHHLQVILRSGRSRITCATQLYLRTPCSAPPPFFSRTACAPALRPTPNSPPPPLPYPSLLLSFSNSRS